MGRAVVGAGGPARVRAGRALVGVQVEVQVEVQGVALEAAMAAGVAEEMDRAVAAAVAVTTRGPSARDSVSSAS